LSSKKIIVVAIPIAVAAAIALAAIFAFPSPLKPSEELAGDNNNINEDKDQGDGEGGEIVPAAAPQNCQDVKGSITNIVVYSDGTGTDETRIAAGDKLVSEYCQRPALVQEMSAMISPGVGLTAYACDISSGRGADSTLKESLAQYAEIYCDSAFFAIYENAEMTLVSTSDYMDEVLEQEEGEADPELGVSYMNATQIQESKAMLQQASDLAKKAKSQLDSEQYYDAAISLDDAQKLLEQYGDA
jgi:hypothetical protein